LFFSIVRISKIFWSSY